MVAKTRGLNTELVFQSILQDMRLGNIVGGDKLVANTLAMRYNVSRTVIREVLVRLVQAGIAESTRNAGCRVRKISIEELCNMYELREALEVIATEKLTQSGAAPWVIAQLRECCERLKINNGVDKQLADRDFHNMIFNSCGSDVISRFARNSFIILMLFNSTLDQFRGRAFHGRSNRVIFKEHSAIVDAIEAGDVKAATRRMASHISKARDVLVKTFLK